MTPHAFPPQWNAGVEADASLARELTTINSSLSALGNCIAALVEADNSRSVATTPSVPADGQLAASASLGSLTSAGTRAHIPYRDSTLTRLLQASSFETREIVLVDSARILSPPAGLARWRHPHDCARDDFREA